MPSPHHGVEHYENFPVASILCPAHLRPAVRAIYGFARTADDLADEGDATPAARLDALAHYRSDLQACAMGQPDSGRWPQVFGPLAAALRELPPVPSGDDGAGTGRGDAPRTSPTPATVAKAEPPPPAPKAEPPPPAQHPSQT
jgi:hypothetical protein